MGNVIISDKASIKATMEEQLGFITDITFNHIINTVEPKITGSLLFNLGTPSLENIEYLVKEGYPKVESLDDYMDRLSVEVYKLRM